VAVGAFTNLSALAGWLAGEDSDVLVLCAGWKNKYNLEDSVYAGALADMLYLIRPVLLPNVTQLWQHVNYGNLPARSCWFYGKGISQAQT
jgi:hypothetical protein